MVRSCPGVNAVALFAALLIAGCGPSGSAPKMGGLGNQVAYVGSEFTLRLEASDADTPELTFSFSNGDLDEIQARATISQREGTVAVFRWTPLVADQGQHAFDFVVSDGSNRDTETVTIEVREDVGEQGAPVFRQPLGTGTTLDLTRQSCVDLAILVEDLDDAETTLAAEEPLVESAELTQEGGFEGTWHWCPTEAQIGSQDRFMLVLSATDGDNHKTLKNYLIVLRKAPKGSCQGSAPMITHTPEDEDTVTGLTIAAEIDDPEGLKAAPLLYYALSDPGAAPNLGAMIQTDMLLIDGDMQHGGWAADVPNPVAAQGAGASAQVYYVIVAQDNDDPTGDCDHVTEAPAGGTYTMTVTNPGGDGNQEACTACTADVQCGGAGDNCVRIAGDYSCGSGCAADTECPTGYVCSTGTVVSIGGASARQCIPEDGSCVSDPLPPCTDDGYEENDTRAMAASKAALPPGSYRNLTSCPASAYAGDEDWYRFVLTDERRVTVAITGGSATNLDLSLVDASGVTVARSESFSSNESLSECLTAGTYFFRVYSWSAAAGSNGYTLTYSTDACSAMCVDDDYEEDDDQIDARRDSDVISVGSPYVSETNAVCPYDEDWYRVDLYDGDTLYVSLVFEQTTESEDLDLHLYQGATDLTPCSEEAPEDCAVEWGQSASSNEQLIYDITDSSYYYVVVHGWNGAANLYDICIGLAPADCPAP